MGTMLGQMLSALVQQGVLQVNDEQQYRLQSHVRSISGTVNMTSPGIPAFFRVLPCPSCDS